jgi:hypothetical protein
MQMNRSLLYMYLKEQFFCLVLDLFFIYLGIDPKKT